MPDKIHQNAEYKDPIKAKSQALLIDFLLADLKLGFTFLRTAEIEAASDPEHCRSALAKVRVALDTIRNLSVRIEDPGTQDAICDRTDKLESALEAFERPTHN